MESATIQFRFFPKGEKKPSSTLSSGLRTTAYSQVLSNYFLTREFLPAVCFFFLTNLDNSDSSVFPMLTPNLARTPDLHRTPAPRNPAFKPFRDLSLQLAGLQACATIPG